MNLRLVNGTKATEFFSSPEFHLLMSGVWMFLLIPTLLWWPNSVLWVLVISLYANFASHLSAYQAAKAEKTLKEVQDDKDEESPRHHGFCHLHVDQTAE